MALRRPFLAALILTAALQLACGLAGAEDKKDLTQTRPSLERITVPLELIDVGDGDTVSIQWTENDRERVRILGIDTPEVAHPNIGMPFDQSFGREATAFCAGVFAAATTVELIRAAETDGYGRTLGYFFVNGMNYSVLVVKARLAVETVTFYGDNGLPAESEAVLAASRTVGPAPFEEPYKFRRRMREIQSWQKDNP